MSQSGSGKPRLVDLGGKIGDIEIPGELPVLAVRNTVLYPSMVLPLIVGRGKSVKLINQVLLGNRVLGVVAQRDAEIEDPGPEDLYTHGSAGTILKMHKLSDDSIRVLIQGVQRVRLKAFTKREPFFTAAIETLTDEIPKGTDIQARVRKVRDLFKQLVENQQTLPREALVAAMNIDDPGMLSDYIATNLPLQITEMQKLLETTNVAGRLELVATQIKKEIDVNELKSSINDEVRQQIDKGQREFYLRQQLKAIRRELGEDDTETQELEEFRERILKAKMPAEVRKEAERELRRMEKMHTESAEYTVARTYLDWLCELPWSKATDDNLDLLSVQEVLDADHYAMGKVKERIVEYLAVRKLKNDMKGPILCFVGPPGVGKTSLGRSIARAMGRKFERIALGGIRDEAEVRGHRRTYVGALPGRIIRALRRANNNNPVFMLDEIDKVGADFRGDPSSALLEVLDPEQNNSFTDHYLDVPFDLSRVLFIATANVLDPIPKPLLDRMEVLEIPGYTEGEKLAIAKKHLIPKQLLEHGLTPEQLHIGDEAVRNIIHSYTREAGLRNLEREIATIARKVARKVAEGRAGKADVTGEDLPEYLQQPRFFSEIAERTNIPGVAVGLAWTPYGGDILFVEATRMRGGKKFSYTGKLGDTMSESAHAAFSYIRSKAKDLHIDENFFEHSDVHVHIPAGAIPKDGPSAGITLASAIASLLTGRCLRPDTAMTGEITLRGKVLQVGGIKDKVLAAARAGIKRIILPHHNEKDIEEVPEEVRASLEFFFVENMDQVLGLAFAGEAPRVVAAAGAA